uniref:Uncharacterized protein n=1 Tax=Arundo donax TaxID=35708 RepID=A0A0A9E7Y5_ARUDO
MIMMNGFTSLLRTILFSRH